MAFDSVQSLAISLCPFRPTIGAGFFIQTPKSLYNRGGVLNIQNLNDDFCFLWCVFAHIHSVDKHAYEVYNYRKYFNELVISGFHFPLKYSDTAKFETLNPTISVNVLVFENNEVFPLYASKISRQLTNDFQQRWQVPLPPRQGLVRSRSWTH